MPTGENARTLPRCPACKAFAHTGPCKRGNQRRAASLEQLERRLALATNNPPAVNRVPLRDTGSATVAPLESYEIAALRDMMRAASPRDLMSIPEASRAAGIAPDTIYHW